MAASLESLEARLDAAGATSSADGLPLHAATLMLTQNILGAGMLSLPYALRTAGLAAGLTLIAFVCVLSVLSMGLLVVLSNHLGSCSYKDSATATLGQRWSILVEVWVLCYTLGICVSYPVLLGDFLCALGNQLGAGAWSSKHFWMCWSVILVCWPLSCVPSLGGLKWPSRLGMVGTLFTTVAVVARYVDGSYDYLGERNNFSAVNLSTLGDCFPILVGAFGAHYNIPTLYREVAPSAGEAGRMMRVIVGAVAISSLVYGIVGVAVYATFGESTRSDFSENFDAGDAWLAVVRVLMALALCVSFPLSLVAARNAVFNIALKPRGWTMKPSLRLGLSTGLSFLCLLVAAAAGEVGAVLAYNGSVFGIPVCFVAPPAMYLRLPRHSQSAGWRVLCAVSIASGVAFGALGIAVVTASPRGR